MSTVTFSHFASPEVVRILEEIRNEESQYVNDLRTSNREHVAVPVQIHTAGENDCWAFSKNVSESGLCLVTPQPYQSNDARDLRFRGLRHECEKMRATCSWGRQFNNSYWISGWKLDNELDVKQVLEEDHWLDIEQRDTERERLAIPVAVHQKNGQPKLNCFSRNISPSGVCLIGNEEPKVSDFSLLELFRSNSEGSRVTADCKWARQLGEAYWISGWQFPRLARIQEFQMRYFQNIPS